MGRFLLRAGVVFFVLGGIYGTAFAMDDWKAEFSSVCGKTQNALAFSVDELHSLMRRCDELKLRIEKLDKSASERKVFLQRLKMCRQFYAFVLGSKTDQD